MRRSKHYLSYYRLLTENMGYLTPIGVSEVLPGDTFRHATSLLLRMAPLVTPVMHPVHVKVHHWYVPHRLNWPEFDDFITGSDPEATHPTIAFPTEASEQTLLDHMGIAPDTLAATPLNALPIRAYNLIYNEFYRDQDLHEEVDLDDTNMLRACWEKDYFTTARTSPQQGANISVPFDSAFAPVKGIGWPAASNATSLNSDFNESDGSTVTYEYGRGSNASNPVPAVKLTSDGLPDVYADLTQATAGIEVAAMRQAFALQRFAEARSRYGSRYVDYLRFLGIRPSDGRLDRPEYLGGGKQTIAFSEVLATAEGENTMVGDLSGHGIAAMRTRSYKRFFEEHGFVISLLIVRPKAMYAQSLHRHWLRASKDDYWQRENEILGQMAVPVKELYSPHTNTTDLFGYVDRYKEYRENPSYVSGSFRDLDDSWHLAREFEAAPVLNASFVNCEPSNRIFGDTNQKQMYIMAQHKIAARRLVSKNARIIT